MNGRHTMLQTVYRITGWVKRNVISWRRSVGLAAVVMAPLFLGFINGNTVLNPQLEPVNITSITRTSAFVVVEWEGAIPPYKLQYRTEVGGVWRDATYHIYGMAYTSSIVADSVFYRVRTIPDKSAPNTPIGFLAVSTGCDRVTLTWDAVTATQPYAGDNSGGTGLRGYNIYRDGVLLGLLPAPASGYVDMGLTASRAYTYSISAVDKALNQSAQVTAPAVSTPSCSTNSPPVARTTFASISAGVNTPVTFNASTSSDAEGAIQSYQWTFGDGGTASGTIVNHSFAANGGYTTRVTVTDSQGATSVANVAVTITNRPPVANAGPDATVTAGTAMIFSAAASSDPDGVITSYLWDFGDFGSGQGVSASHVFANPGTYQVTLMVADSLGAAANDTVQVTVTAVPNVPPVANAGADKTGSVGAALSFSSTGSSDPDGTITSYAWNFGDGGTAASGSANHTYTAVGSYTVTLTVTDNRGASRSDTAAVTITAAPNVPPVAQAGADKTSGVGYSVPFSGAASTDSDGTIATYSWNFGDGTTASGASVARSYTGAGNYTVTLTVTDNSGASASDTASVTITNLTTPPPSTNQPGLMEVSGYFPTVGVARKVAVSGNYAYVASDKIGLSVVDLRNPAVPQVVSAGDRPFSGGHIAVNGSYAVVTGGRTYSTAVGIFASVSCFYVFDVSNPLVPQRVGFLEDVSGYRGVALAGRYAYVCSLSGFHVVDLVNPARPQIVGSNALVGGAYSLAVSGNIVYVADGLSGLKVLDVSVPNNPRVVGVLDTPNNAVGVSVVGNRAYIADGNAVLVVDINNPAAPIIRGSASCTALDVVGTATMAYAASSTSGTTIIDATNPNAPFVAALAARSVPGSGGSVGVALAGTSVVVADSFSGLAIVDVSSATTAHQVAAEAELLEGYKIVSKPGWALLAGTLHSDDGSLINELRVLDTSNPAKPRLAAKLTSSTYGFNGIALSGNYAYVACGWAGLQVLDITRPDAPIFVGTGYDSPGNAASVSISGNYAYLADGSQGIKILNISNPLAPVLVGGIDTPGNAADVVAAGNYAYVADANSLKVVDVSNPAAPVIRGTLSTTAVAVQVVNNIVYLAASTEGLVVVNVANSASPVKLATLDATGGSNGKTLGFLVKDNSVYMANGDGGFAVADISSPSAPRLTAMTLTTGFARAVAVEGDWAYLADNLGGINAIRFR